MKKKNIYYKNYVQIVFTKPDELNEYFGIYYV